MVFPLGSNVSRDRCDLRSADATGEISLLPLESRILMLVHPARGIRLNYLHGLCNAERWPEIHKRMHMILDSADGDRVHAMVRNDSRHICPKFRLDIFADEFHPVCRTEDNVDVITHM